MVGVTNSRPRCLVAEDESIIGMMMEVDLDHAGFEIIGPFPSCSAALGWLKQATPDFALIDYKLSDGACVELARELKSRAVPFAILSGSMDPWVRARPEFVGVPWLAKPVSESALTGVLKSLYPASSIGVPDRSLTQGVPVQV
jgi:two-component SAPR family response regulator